jgi:GPR1/FUN34/yaaH family
MKINRILLLIGMVLYIGSFFLIAIKDAQASASASGYAGYWCAYVTLLFPWGHDGWSMLHEEPANYFAVLLSGWINPVFLATVALLLRKPNSRLVATLRVVVLLMFAACWIVFYKEHLRPQAGYFLWTAAMLLVLFSNVFSRADRELNTAAKAA